MKVLFHPEFPKDVRKFAGDYREVSPGLEARFRIEGNEAIATVKASPTGVGHGPRFRPSSNRPPGWQEVDARE